jgi:transposase
MCSETRYIGLDIHKNYMVAAGVDREQNVVLKPRRVGWERFEGWMRETLRPDDRVVLEMTVNTWEVHDQLKAHVDSVTVVHPPHVALITRAQVITDRKSALTLAKLHAAGLLVGIWVPDEHTRDLRAIIAQRAKMVRLRTQAKNRLRALLHRRQIRPPEGGSPFDPELRDWWLSLPLSRLELARVENDLATLDFAERQRDVLEEVLGEEAANDERVPLLIQIPGVGLITAMAILGAVGVIERFPEARKLVGYAGLGAKVKDSGERRTTGSITKSGRRDLRKAMVDAANHAVQHHPFWKPEFDRLEYRLGRSRAIVAIARKLLIVVWHVLTKGEVDRRGDPENIARSLFAHAYRVGVRNLPGGMSAKEYTRFHLERLGIADQVPEFRWGSKRVRL